jgi:hypothetical protein
VVSQAGGHPLIFFSPDVNVLKPMGSSNSRKGYLTGGLGLNVISASGASSENRSR